MPENPNTDQGRAWGKMSARKPIARLRHIAGPKRERSWLVKMWSYHF